MNKLKLIEGALSKGFSTLLSDSEAIAKVYEALESANFGISRNAAYNITNALSKVEYKLDSEDVEKLKAEALYATIVFAYRALRQKGTTQEFKELLKIVRKAFGEHVVKAKGEEAKRELLGYIRFRKLFVISISMKGV